VGPVQAALQVFRPFRSFTGNADPGMILQRKLLFPSQEAVDSIDK
jgi:hypothetical protein